MPLLMMLSDAGASAPWPRFCRFLCDITHVLCMVYYSCAVHGLLLMCGAWFTTHVLCMVYYSCAVHGV